MSALPSKRYDEETKKQTARAVVKLQEIINDFRFIDHSSIIPGKSKKVFKLDWGGEEIQMDPLFAKRERYKDGDFGLVNFKNHKRLRVEVEGRLIQWHFDKILNKEWETVHWFYRKINTPNPAHWCVSFSPDLDYCYMFSASHVIRYAQNPNNIEVIPNMKKPGGKDGDDTVVHISKECVVMFYIDEARKGLVTIWKGNEYTPIKDSWVDMPTGYEDLVRRELGSQGVNHLQNASL